jgi:hypothetical protein
VLGLFVGAAVGTSWGQVERRRAVEAVKDKEPDRPVCGYFGLGIIAYRAVHGGFIGGGVGCVACVVGIFVLAYPRAETD